MTLEKGSDELIINESRTVNSEEIHVSYSDICEDTSDATGNKNIFETPVVESVTPTRNNIMSEQNHQDEVRPKSNVREAGAVDLQIDNTKEKKNVQVSSE